jgi:hypothetical protein
LLRKSPKFLAWYETYAPPALQGLTVKFAIAGTATSGICASSLNHVTHKSPSCVQISMAVFIPNNKAMRTRNFFFTACALLFCLPLTTHAQRRPNIILIRAGDLGYGDVGVYGQRKFRTLHLDKMAAEGTRFTAYCAGSTVGAPSPHLISCVGDAHRIRPLACSGTRPSERWNAQ